MTSGMEAPGPRNCVSCGRSIPWDANVCPYCGHDYRMRMMPVPVPPKSQHRAGGALIVAAGILAMVNGIAGLAVSTMDFESLGVAPPTGVTLSEFRELVVVLAIAALVLGFIAIIGGIFAMQKRRFGWAVIGGVTGILGFGLVIGTILAITGLVLVAMSRDEFDRPVQPIQSFDVL